MAHRLMIRRLSAFLCTLAALLMAGCGADENPNLVNPPITGDTIRLRLLNLAGDAQARDLEIERSVARTAVPFGTLSLSSPSAFDSALVGTRTVGADTPEFRTTSRLRFQRNTFQTLVALPTTRQALQQRAVDTIIRLASLAPGDDLRADQAGLRFVNFIPDTPSFYSVRIGCPNGPILANELTYRGVAPYLDIERGDYIVTLTRRRLAATEVVGSFRVPIATLGDYSIIAWSPSPNIVRLSLLEERGEGPTAFADLQQVEQTPALMRVVNFGSSTVEGVKRQDQVSFGVALPGQPTAYEEIPVCTSQDADTLEARSGNSVVSIATASLDVLRRYSLFTAETSPGTWISTVVGPAPAAAIPTGYHRVRAVNLLGADFGGITVAVGTRTSTAGAALSGESIAASLDTASVSAPTLLPTGQLPVTVFSVNAPVRLLASGLLTLQEGKDYTIAVYRQADGTVGVRAVEQEGMLPSIQMQNGAFVQIANVLGGETSTRVSVGPVSNYTLPRSGSIATVVGEGPSSVQIAGVTQNFTAQAGTRITAIAYGNTNTQQSVFLWEGTPPPLTPLYIGRRYLNLAEDRDTVTIYNERNSPGFAIVEQLQKAELTGYFQESLERRQTLVFASGPDNLFQLSNVFYLYGKAYSIIFYGSSGNYGALILQDY